MALYARCGDRAAMRNRSPTRGCLLPACAQSGPLSLFASVQTLHTVCIAFHADVVVMQASGLRPLHQRYGRQPCLPSCSYSVAHHGLITLPRQQLRPAFIHSPSAKHSRRPVACSYDSNWGRTEREMQQKYRDISSQYEAKARQLAEQYEARARDLRSMCVVPTSASFKWLLGP